MPYFPELFQNGKTFGLTGARLYRRNATSVASG